MIFSCNPSSARFFASLPGEIRKAILKRLEYINTQVVSFFPNAHVTSAFRSPRYSLSIGSHPDSWHGYGCAIDYRKGTVKKDSSGGRSLEKKGFYLLEEESCIHVQFTGELG